MVQDFTSRIHFLIPRPKWFTSDLVKVGDICLFVMDDGLKPKLWTWKIGKVVDISGRRLTIGYFIPSSAMMKTLQRNPREVSVILSPDELAVNTLEHYLKLTSECTSE